MDVITDSQKMGAKGWQYLDQLIAEISRYREVYRQNSVANISKKVQRVVKQPTKTKGKSVSAG